MELSGDVDSKIWIGCLASYNRGHLHGEWIDINVDSFDIERFSEACDSLCDEVSQAIQKVLDGSPFDDSEEFGIFDFEGFGPLRLDEYENIRDVVRVSVLKAKYGEIALYVAANHGLSELEYIQEMFEQTYEGGFETLEDWAEEKLGSILSVVGTFKDLLHKKFGPVALSKNYCMSNLRTYLGFDTLSWAQDLEMGGYIEVYEVDHQIHVFWV